MFKKIQAWIQANRKEAARFSKFLVVGTMGALVDFGVFNLMGSGFGLPVLPANTISFTTAVVSNFLWNRYWTYPDSRSKPIRRQLVQFFAVNIVGWAINTSIVLLLKTPMAGLAGTVAPLLGIILQAGAVETLGKNMAKVIATGIVLFWNFFINRIWTYNDVQ